MYRVVGQLPPTPLPPDCQVTVAPVPWELTTTLRLAGGDGSAGGVPSGVLVGVLVGVMGNEAPGVAVKYINAHSDHLLQV